MFGVAEKNRNEAKHKKTNKGCIFKEKKIFFSILG